MNQSRFEDICEMATRALQVDGGAQDGRCSFTIDGIEVLVDLNEEVDTLHCYVDLGNPGMHDRTEVCEQLLALNLQTHSNHYGAYAFQPGSGRAIFCIDLPEASTLDGDEFAQMLRYYVDETEEARQMVSGISVESRGHIFSGELI